MKNREWSKETIAVQGGYEPKDGETRVLPIYQSATFKYSDPDHLAALFDLKEEGHLYSRISNPTVDALEKKFALLEGGVGAVATSSGQAAVLLAVLNICSAGDNIISVSSLYGGTINLFNVHLKNLGIETRFVSPDASEEEIIALADEKTKLVYGETIGNPGLNILDFDKFKEVCEKIQVPLVIDNTVASPYHCNPIELGANIVIHSTTKYADGHAQSIGGIVIDGGNFNWNNGKFSGLVDPDPSYHGISYTKEFKEAAYIVKLRAALARDFGTCMSPFNAYLVNLGLETLTLRMAKHSENALAVAKYLSNNEKISWVNYPYLEGSDHYTLGKKYLKNGASGLLTFGIKGGIEEAKNFCRELKLIALAVTLGDTRSCILHPATTTHGQLSEEEQIASGVTPDMLRLSVGIEDVNDILNDIKNALKNI